MVSTRSMSGTTKKTDTKIVVNDKLKAAKIPSNKAKIPSNKAKSSANDKLKAAKIPSNKAKSRKTRGCTYADWSVMDEAYNLFRGDRRDEHYEKHPPRPTWGTLSKELRLAFAQEWEDMSDKDKAPFLKRAKKMWAKGCTPA